MAFQIITDMEVADELWKQGALWLQCSTTGEVRDGATWVPIIDYMPGNEGHMAPSAWNPRNNLTAHYAVLLEA